MQILMVHPASRACASDAGEWVPYLVRDDGRHFSQLRQCRLLAQLSLNLDPTREIVKDAGELALSLDGDLDGGASQVFGRQMTHQNANKPILKEILSTADAKPPFRWPRLLFRWLVQTLLDTADVWWPRHSVVVYCGHKIGKSVEGSPSLERRDRDKREQARRTRLPARGIDVLR